MEQVMRVWKNTKSIEQSTQAYYLASSAIEKQLMATDNLKKKPWEITGTWVSTSYSGYTLTVSTGSTVIPEAGKGNSPFNPDYNLITLDRPIQLVIQDGLNWTNIDFNFRIPDSSSNGTKTWSIDSSTTNELSWALIWTLWNSDLILFASGASADGVFRMQELNNTDKIISSKRGYFYSWSTFTPDIDFLGFYENSLTQNFWKCTNFSCTLKISMLTSIPVTINSNKVNLPFLEYKISGLTTAIPSQFMTLNAEGKVGEYKRFRRVYIPQITTNTALDFAVLQ